MSIFPLYSKYVLYVNLVNPMSSGRYTYFVLHMAMHVFMCTHFRNVRRKCHTIRIFTFDLHTTTTWSERHVSVCLHALIVQMFCRIYCRILCKILFPHIARSHTFSKDEYESHGDPQAISKKISVQQPQASKHTFQEDLCTTSPGDL